MAEEQAIVEARNRELAEEQAKVENRFELTRPGYATRPDNWRAVRKPAILSAENPRPWKEYGR
jgi:hypothetical protein